MPTLQIEHRYLQPLMGQSLVTWNQHPEEELFETIRNGSDIWLEPNPRMFSLPWRFYKKNDIIFEFTGTDSECQAVSEWIITQASPYSF